MSTVPRQLRVGAALVNQAIQVFPLFGNDADLPLYSLATEGMKLGTVLVRETGKSGVVSELEVQNKGNAPVLFVEGDHIVGLKQNRIVNASLFVGPNRSMAIPVSCVEQGRWRNCRHKAYVTKSHSTPKMRGKLRQSIRDSGKEERNYNSNQSEIWDCVNEMQAFHRISSPTLAMRDVEQRLSDNVANFQAACPYVNGAIGMAIAVNGQFVVMDVFDKASTCEAVWYRLVLASFFEVASANTKSDLIQISEIEKIVRDAARIYWKLYPPIGDGKQYRGELHGCYVASQLALDDVSVHESLVVTSFRSD